MLWFLSSNQILWWEKAAQILSVNSFVSDENYPHFWENGKFEEFQGKIQWEISVKKFCISKL